MDLAEQMASEVAEVVLPSKGVLYGGKIPDGVLHVRPLTTREEKILLSLKAESRQRTMYKIVQDCIIEEDRKKMPFSDYLVGDVIYLFIFIRALTYDPEYMFFPACRYCGKPFKVELRIPHDLGIYKLTEDTVEPFKAVLPKSGKEVGLRLLRMSDEREIEAYVKRHRREDDPEFAYRIARHLVSFDGADVDPEDPETIARVNALHAKDTEHIRETVVDNDCGVDLLLDRDCTECGRENELWFEMTADFFRSKSAKVRRRRGTIG